MKGPAEIAAAKTARSDAEFGSLPDTERPFGDRLWERIMAAHSTRVNRAIDLRSGVRKKEDNTVYRGSWRSRGGSHLLA
jgi:hypothetical protein